MTDEGRDAPPISFVGAAACPDAPSFIRRTGEAQPSRREARDDANHKCLPPLIRLCFAKPPSPKGRLFSVPAGFFVDSYRSIFATWRAGHAHAPTLKNGSAYRPSSVAPKGVTPSPRGRLFCPFGAFRKKSAPADGFRLALVFFSAPGGYFSSGRGSGETTGLPSRSRRTVRPPA